MLWCYCWRPHVEHSLIREVILCFMCSMEDGGADEEDRVVKKFRMGKLFLTG